MLQRLIAVVIVAVVLFAGIGAISNGYESSVRGAYDATSYSESFNVSGGTLVTVNESNRDVVYNETVNVSQGGTEVDDSEYTWYANNGTLFVPSGSTLANEQASITYGLTEPDEQQRLARDVGNIPAVVLGGTFVELAGFAALIGAVVVMVRVGGR